MEVRFLQLFPVNVIQNRIRFPRPALILETGLQKLCRLPMDSSRSLFCTAKFRTVTRPAVSSDIQRIRQSPLHPHCSFRSPPARPAALPVHENHPWHPPDGPHFNEQYRPGRLPDFIEDLFRRPAAHLLTRLPGILQRIISPQFIRLHHSSCTSSGRSSHTGPGRPFTTRYIALSR